MTATNGGALGRRRLLLAAAAFSVCLGLRFQACRHAHLADDAFITFRYAANLAAGRGLAFNEDEPVLGTTTPLLALLLAAARLGGLDIVATGQAVALAASAAGCALLCDIVWLASASWAAALGAACLLALSSSQAQIAVSGMETPLMGALMLGSYHALLRGRPQAAGLLAGLVAFARPEGLAWLLPVVPFLRTERRWHVGGLLAALMPVMLWGLFSWAYFGSPVPQSMLAKMAQGQVVDKGVVATTSKLLVPLGFGPIVLATALAGVWLAVREDRRVAIPLGFSAAFLAAYALGRPMLYPWYPGPLDTAFCLIGGLVLARAASAADPDVAPGSSRRRSWAVTALTVTCLAVLVNGRSEGHYSLLTRRVYPEPHLQLARWLSEHTRPGDTILVGDVGYVGYYNLGRRVVDYYGLVWRAPDHLLRGTMGPTMGTPWLGPTVEALAPDVVALHQVDTPARPPGGYRVVTAPGLDAYRILVARRGSAPDGPAGEPASGPRTSGGMTTGRTLPSAP